MSTKFNEIELLEKTLEDILFDLIKHETDYDKNLIREQKGLNFLNDNTFFCDRQVNIGTDYGIADIVLYSNPTGKYKVSFTVIELKKDTIGFDTYEQAYRYVTVALH